MVVTVPEETLAAALGVDFEVILADRVGVIAAESGAVNPDPAQQLADLVRDVAREIVRGNAQGAADPGETQALASEIRKAASGGEWDMVRSAVIRGAAHMLRTAMDASPGPQGLKRSTTGRSGQK